MTLLGIALEMLFKQGTSMLKWNRDVFTYWLLSMRALYWEDFRPTFATTFGVVPLYVPGCE